MGSLKKNVDAFNRDVRKGQGYRYTTQAAYSSIVANRRMTEATLAYLPAKAQTLLDIGCGDGTYSHDLAAARPGLQVTGLDAAEEAVAVAQKKYPALSFQVADAAQPFILGRKFHVGVIRGLLHHTSAPNQVIRQAAQAADRLIILEPNGNNPVLKLVEKLSPYHREHEERSFSAGLLRRWCHEAGLKILKTDYIGFVPFFFPEYLARILYFVQPFLEKVPFVRECFTAQIVLVCEASGSGENVQA